MTESQSVSQFTGLEIDPLEEKINRDYEYLCRELHKRQLVNKGRKQQLGWFSDYLSPPETDDFSLAKLYLLHLSKYEQTLLMHRLMRLKAYICGAHEALAQLNSVEVCDRFLRDAIDLAKVIKTDTPWPK